MNEILQQSLANGLDNDELSNNKELNDKETQLEQKTDEAEQAEEQQHSAEEKLNYYTAEELQYIIENDLPIDTKRLTPEGIAIMKSFQRGFTPKLQEASAIKNEFERLKKELEEIRERTKSPEEKLKEEFLKNPQGVIAEINSAISDLTVEAAVAKQEGDEAKFAELKSKIATLSTIKDKLLLETVKTNNNDNKAMLAQQALEMAIQKAPVLKEKGDDIYNFAITKLGYTPESLAKILDTVSNGVDVVANNLVLLAKAYEADMLKQQAQQIKQKTQNTLSSTLVPPVSGGNEDVLAQYNKLLNEAREGKVTLAEILEFKQKYNIR